MIRRPPKPTRPYTLFPSPTLFRSARAQPAIERDHIANARVHRKALAKIEHRRFVGQMNGAVSHAAVRSRSWSPALPPIPVATCRHAPARSEEHTSELQSLMRISYAVFCLKKKKYQQYNTKT